MYKFSKGMSICWTRVQEKRTILEYNGRSLIDSVTLEEEFLLIEYVISSIVILLLLIAHFN